MSWVEKRPGEYVCMIGHMTLETIETVWGSNDHCWWVSVSGVNIAQGTARTAGLAKATAVFHTRCLTLRALGDLDALTSAVVVEEWSAEEKTQPMRRRH